MTETMGSDGDSMYWGLILVSFLVMAVLLLSGATLIKIMFFEGRGKTSNAIPPATPIPAIKMRVGLRPAFLTPLAVFLSLSLAFGWGLTQNPKEIPSALINKPVPTFTLPPVQGRHLGLASRNLSGEVSLVNVFASWCGACRQEHPVLLRLKADGVVPIHGLNYKDRPADAAHWLDMLGDPYARTGADQDGRVGIEWGVYGVPQTYVVNADGRIAFKHVGPVTPEALNDVILPLVEQLRSKKLGSQP